MIRRKRLWAAVVLAVLALAAPARAQAEGFPPGIYLLEFEILEDECGHDPFIPDLPESVYVTIDPESGSLLLEGEFPWIPVVVEFQDDGSLLGMGSGEVAGFPGVTVGFLGEVVEPGVIEGALAFGTEGELPGECPIIWRLTLIADFPVETPETTTTTATTTTSPTTTTTEAISTETSEVTETSGGVSVTVTTEGTVTSEPGTVATTTGGFPWWILIGVGLLLIAFGLWWLRVLRRPLTYGGGMSLLLGGLASGPPPEEGGGETTETTSDTSTTETTTETTTTTDHLETTTTEEPDIDDTTTEERDDTSEPEETTTEDHSREETTTEDHSREETTTEDHSREETTTEDHSPDETTTEGGSEDGTRDGTIFFGPRTRVRGDCTPLVDECERLRAEAQRARDMAARMRSQADRAKKWCADATANAENLQKRYDDLEPRTDAMNYYERITQAGIDLRSAQSEARQACGQVDEAVATADRYEADAAEAKVRADEACARAAECLELPSPGTRERPPTTPEEPAPTDPGGSSTTTRAQRPAKRCGPEAGQAFVDCMNRILSRLVVLFGRDTWRATGYDFLVRNGGIMDFWILSEYLDDPCFCPTRCGETVTLFGTCYPHHVMSDFMYGFFAGWFNLSDTEIDLGSAGWKMLKWAASEFSAPVATPEWYTVSMPSYAAGAAAAREIRPDVHQNVAEYHITEGLSGVAKRDDCEPCPCRTQAKPDKDFSKEEWNWPEPLDVLDKWAVHGDEPR